MSDTTTELGHAEPDEKDTRVNDESAKAVKDGDLEKQETMKEGEVATEDAEAARREWIRTAPESPRNWPLWKKCEFPCLLPGIVAAVRCLCLSVHAVPLFKLDRHLWASSRAYPYACLFERWAQLILYIDEEPIPESH